jgi:hypothetical protein
MIFGVDLVALPASVGGGATTGAGDATGGGRTAADGRSQLAANTSARKLRAIVLTTATRW